MLIAKPANVKRLCVIVMMRLGRRGAALAARERRKIALRDSLLDRLVRSPLLSIAHIPSLLGCADSICVRRQSFPFTRRAVAFLTRLSSPRSVRPNRKIASAAFAVSVHMLRKRPNAASVNPALPHRLRGSRGARRLSSQAFSSKADSRVGHPRLSSKLLAYLLAGVGNGGVKRL